MSSVLAVHEDDAFAEKSEVTTVTGDNGAIKMEYFTQRDGEIVKLKGKIEIDASKAPEEW